MATGSGSVWAIDIGDNSLKALHLSGERGVVEVLGFANIHHSKILSGPGISETEKDELIALSLREFLSENDLRHSDVIISVPSQNSFARFVNLPPVEKKRIPKIVEFEAAQQIPFDINEVQWDWQLMTDEGSTESKVGLFAIKSDIVMAILEHFTRENINVSYVQMVPMALYNYALHDRSDLFGSDSEATVIIDIGTENTDLVVCTKSMVWQRCIPMGGNAFTRAISDTFKLSFEKAEKLKRTAPMSKYARQIFQAMRPVFSDLASEIQRSLGFYTSSNQQVKLSRMMAFGGGTKMRGLLKYLGQTLQIPIEMPDSFKKVAMGSSVTAAKFHENVSDFGIVYGLALQVLGLGRIVSNLLPQSLARSMAWAGKSKHFIGASLLLLLVSLLALGRTFYDMTVYNSSQNDSDRRTVKKVLSDVDDSNRKLKTQTNRGAASEAVISKAREPFLYRDVVLNLQEVLLSILPNEKNNPSQSALYKSFSSSNIESVLEIPRKERKLIFLTSMFVRYSNDISTSPLGDIQSMMYGSQGGMGGDSMISDEEDIWGDRASRFSGSRTGMMSPMGGTGMPSLEKFPGFIVTIEGYSPYKDIVRILDPSGVGNDKSKWGVVTRLMNLEELSDSRYNFELFKREEVGTHFNLERGAVSIGAESKGMPYGIGIRESKEGTSVSDVIIDPMTREQISHEPELDEDGNEKKDRQGEVIYQANDHWFRLQFKISWKNSPKSQI
ncbi:MAG: type IV pilus assembly protein PilM [Planctomycetota bacterium]|jgi:type IV pilus assembly protein PilM